MRLPVDFQPGSNATTPVDQDVCNRKCALGGLHVT